jgi:hypothetical protein
LAGSLWNDRDQDLPDIELLLFSQFLKIIIIIIKLKMHLCGDLNVEMEKKNKISYESGVAKYGGPLLKRRLSIKRIGLRQRQMTIPRQMVWPKRHYCC